MLQHCYSKRNSKGICLAARNGRLNWNFTFINAIAVSLFLLQLSFTCNRAFYFSIGRNLWRHISFSFTCFSYYRKHPNNRRSRPEVFCRKGLRPAPLLKRRVWHRCFPVNFTKFLRTPFLQNISGGCFCNKMKLEWTPLLSNFN